MYGGNISSEVQSNLRRLERPAVQIVRERLSVNLHANHSCRSIHDTRFILERNKRYVNHTFKISLIKF